MRRHEIMSLLWVLLAAALSLMLAAGCGASGGTATNAEEPPAQEETSAVDEEQAEGPPAPRFATGAVTGLSPVTTLYVEAGPKSVELMPGGGRIFVNDLYAHKLYLRRDTYEVLEVIPCERAVETISLRRAFAWVSLYNTSKVVVVDTGGAITAQVQTGSIPKEIAISPDGKWSTSPTGTQTPFSVIDAASHARVKTSDVRPLPAAWSFSPTAQGLYVA